MSALRWLYLIAILSLSACSDNSDNGNRSSGRDNVSVKTTLQNADSAQGGKSRFAAAEAFEALAEKAFTASPADLKRAIKIADDATLALGKSVPDSLAESLQNRLAEIREAGNSEHRPDLALAAIEAFREIVGTTSILSNQPVEVGLLDYAGFRINADAQAQPPRWQDMNEAMSFARARWAMISQFPALSKLRDPFDTVLKKLQAAIATHDVNRTRAAAKTELDMVDELEAAFAKPA